MGRALEFAEPDRLELQLASPTTDSAFVFVAENYFPDWNATVDGRSATVVRSQVSLMAVAVPPGARSIVLEFNSDGARFLFDHASAVGAAQADRTVAAWGRSRRAPRPLPRHVGRWHRGLSA